MAMTGFALIYGALMWLDSWTAHGEVAIVPDVKGNDLPEAIARLQADGFDVELSDSVYNRHARPGVVVEQNPKLGAKVKPGRTIYLTINAFSPKKVTIPSLSDVSLRQARSILEGLGIENIRVIPVRSEFRDLVMGAKVDGSPVSAGARVPVTSTVTLEVGDGLMSPADFPDNTATTPGDDELLQLP